MQVTQIGSNVTLERCDVQTVTNVTNVNCQYQNEDFKTDTGDKTGEYVVAQENCDLNRNNGGNGEEVNTKEVAQQITAELKRYSIPQAIFAQRVLCRSQVIFRFPLNSMTSPLKYFINSNLTKMTILGYIIRFAAESKAVE